MIRKVLGRTLMGCAAVLVVLALKTASHADTIVLEGTLNKAKLKPANVYLLRGGVFIKKKLVVRPGVQVFGLPGSFLVIDKGARIIADGTPENPIVFTSAAPPGTRRRGDWGGLIINGEAPINVPGGTAQGEGSTGSYGGTDPDDDSGIMRYVRVEYGGFAISPDNELNCLAFQGVGSSTMVDFVEAFAGGDDGFEWFGGTMNARHLVSVAASDDSFDWTFGWNGRVQFALVQQRSDEADAGIEADNNENDFNFTPRSSPRLMNFTMIGDPAAGPGSTRGVLLRRGTAGHLRNFLVMGFKNVGLEVRDAPTFTQMDSDLLTLRGFIFFNNGAGLTTPANFAGATATGLTSKGVKILQSDPQLANAFDRRTPDFRPLPGSPALNAANAEPPITGDTFFVTANYVGAFDVTNNWISGWTKFVFGD